MTDKKKTPPAAGTAGRGDIDLVIANQGHSIGTAERPQQALDIRWLIRTELHHGRKRIRALLGDVPIGHAVERVGIWHVYIARDHQTRLTLAAAVIALRDAAVKAEEQAL